MSNTKFKIRSFFVDVNWIEKISHRLGSRKLILYLRLIIYLMISTQNMERFYLSTDELFIFQFQYITLDFTKSVSTVELA